MECYTQSVISRVVNNYHEQTKTTKGIVILDEKLLVMQPISIIKWLSTVVLTASLLFSISTAAGAIVSYNIDAIPSETEEPLTYIFTNLHPGDMPVPPNSSEDLANGIIPVIISGVIHNLSGPATKLTDGPGATNDDQPSNNLFFANNNQGRFRISLTAISAVSQINVYSWHRFTTHGLRAPQDYEVYASDGTSPGFDINDPLSPGWVHIAQVVSNDIFGPLDGQYGVSIGPDSGVSLGNFQHVLFDVHPPTNGIDNTFFSEIDIIGTEVVEVEIDIKPGSDPNSINLSSAGVIPVAIFSSDTFDATTVDPESLFLAGSQVKVAGKSGKSLCHEEDINDDGLIDLVCKFEVAVFMVEEGADTAEIIGETENGVKFKGNDLINIVP